MFSLKYIYHPTEHRCTFPGCKNVLVIDGNMKTDVTSALPKMQDQFLTQASLGTSRLDVWLHLLLSLAFVCNTK